MVEYLTDWLENGISESYIGICSWGPEDEHSRTGETLNRSWDLLHQLGVVTETTTVCLPNPLPLDLSIESSDYLVECLVQLQR